MYQVCGCRFVGRSIGYSVSWLVDLSVGWLAECLLISRSLVS